MRQIIWIPFLVCLCGCRQSETKKIIRTYKNGAPEIVYYLADKNDSATYRKECLYESGKREYAGNIDKGVKTGIWTWWYENGNKKDQCKYVGGFYADTVFHWYENGVTKQIEIVAAKKIPEDGCCNCNGTIIRYDKTGKLNAKFTSLDEKFQGPYFFVSGNGGWIIRTYKNDTLNGLTIEHVVDSDKVTIIAGQYENGLETGLWKWFDKDSVLTFTTIYVKGEVFGERISYYPNGGIKSSGITKGQEYQGEVSYFDTTGKLIKRELHKGGKLLRTVKNM